MFPGCFDNYYLNVSRMILNILEYEFSVAGQFNALNEMTLNP
jgi:hypothetical protein